MHVTSAVKITTLSYRILLPKLCCQLLLERLEEDLLSLLERDLNGEYIDWDAPLCAYDIARHLHRILLRDDDCLDTKRLRAVRCVSRSRTSTVQMSAS